MFARCQGEVSSDWDGYVYCGDHVSTILLQYRISNAHKQHKQQSHVVQTGIGGHYSQDILYIAYLVHIADPCLLHSLTALGHSHEAQEMLLEDVLGFAVKAAIVVPRLLEIVLLLNALLDSGTNYWLLGPRVVALGLAGSIVINVILLGWVIVHLHQTQNL